MGEKRKYIRFNVILDALCRRGDDKKRVKVNNFCKEGVGLMSSQELAEGEDVEMEMLIPGDNIPVILEGEIAWTNGPNLDSASFRSGVKFRKISNEDKSRLLEFIYHRWMAPASAGAE